MGITHLAKEILLKGVCGCDTGSFHRNTSLSPATVNKSDAVLKQAHLESVSCLLWLIKC